MSKVLIEESTLTALGDALRSKEFIPATRKGTIVVDCITLTLNTVSDTDPYWNGEYEQSSSIDISFPEATSLKFEMEAYADGNKYISGPIGRVYFDYDYLFPISKTKDGDEYYSNTVFSSNTSGNVSITRESYSHSLGVIIRIYPLDAEGNAIPGLVPKEIDITNTVSPAVMIDSINSFDIAKILPEEAFKLTGDCGQKFVAGKWDWFLDEFGDRITTENITRTFQMFNNSQVERIPFTLNVADAYELGSTFSGCQQLIECPKIRGTIKWNTSTNLASVFESCRRLRDLEDLFEPSMLDGFSTVKVTGAYSSPKACGIKECTSLRKVPSWFYKFKLCEDSTAYPNYTYSIYYSAFSNCYNLDEVVNYPVWRCTAAQTSNLFMYSLGSCSRLKNFTFETQADGTPYEVKWKSQTIDLSQNTGNSTSSTDYFTAYNSGITIDKRVKDDATYQALKDDPDWFTTDIAFSRYNHDSAVATINSLPDTSAYLASAGGTNTIKFKKANGSKTDGGAIESLTAEEIAVATAKGWTVTLV